VTNEDRSSARAEPADHPQVRLLRMMARVREFELLCQRLWYARVGPGPTGEVNAAEEMPGFVHLSIGQEAVSVGVCTVLRTDDQIASTHRGHGHVIAKGGDVNKVMAELYGRVTGYCRGKGGSMHIFAPEIGVLGTNGIVGGGIPHAVGAALSHKLLGRDNVAVTFFGDGASNQGVFFESMNLAALWALPVVFVCENNLYSEWTNYERLTASVRIADRAIPFGIPSVQVDGTDVLAVRDATAEAVRRARAGRGPSLIEARTYIHCGHMEGEEVFAGRYRSDEEISSWELRDPIVTFGQRLVAAGLADEAALEQVRVDERERAENALKFAIESLPPDLSELTDHLWAEKA
jgi:acetoin:2,6-dichlorophenolindophenol oxidoreductase subunit alpha